jgi:hypothetical protein
VVSELVADRVGGIADVGLGDAERRRAPTVEPFGVSADGRRPLSLDRGKDLADGRADLRPRLLGDPGALLEVSSHRTLLSDRLGC